MLNQLSNIAHVTHLTTIIITYHDAVFKLYKLVLRLFCTIDSSIRPWGAAPDPQVGSPWTEPQVPPLNTVLTYYLYCRDSICS